MYWNTIVASSTGLGYGTSVLFSPHFICALRVLVITNSDVSGISSIAFIEGLN